MAARIRKAGHRQGTIRVHIVEVFDLFDLNPHDNRGKRTSNWQHKRGTSLVERPKPHTSLIVPADPPTVYISRDRDLNFEDLDCEVNLSDCAHSENCHHHTPLPLRSLRQVSEVY